jgi:predicted RNA-binding Zn-ribbon protein involved in translation (DUF1610 family)
MCAEVAIVKESKSRIPFKCPKCGHETKRGLRQGGVLSSTFRCESCGQKSIASGYRLFSTLYGIVLGGVLVLLTFALISSPWNLV